jgi:hypothetical protein
MARRSAKNSSVSGEITRGGGVPAKDGGMAAWRRQRQSAESGGGRCLTVLGSGVVVMVVGGRGNA